MGQSLAQNRPYKVFFLNWMKLFRLEFKIFGMKLNLMSHYGISHLGSALSSCPNIISSLKVPDSLT